MRNASRFIAFGIATTATLSMLACRHDGSARTDMTPTTTTPPTATATGYYTPTVPQGWGAAQQAFPTGDVRTSALLVHEVMPNAVRKGQMFTPEIHVTNITSGMLQNVMVETSGFRNLDIATATPTGTKTGDGWSWMIGDLAPGQTQIVRITGKADAVGTAGNCLDVSYANTLCAATRVVEPALALESTITPQSILGCDPISMTITARNTGTGDATNVRISQRLPEGLTTADGKAVIDIPVGVLAAGQSKPFTVPLRATKTGKFQAMASARADGDLTAETAKLTTTVTQPVLAVSCKGPEQVGLGRDVTFNFMVKNTGDAPSDKTVLTAALPAGATGVQMSDGATGGSWTLGTLAPGMERAVTLSFRPVESVGSTVQVFATAASRCAKPATTSCTTTVFGLPDIGTLVTDDNVDIVRVGQNHTYRIEIKNQGQVNLTGVKMVLTLPEGLDFVSSPTAVVSGRTVTFNLGTVTPGRAVNGTFVAKASLAGEKLVVGETTCNEIKTPLRDNELTNFVK